MADADADDVDVQGSNGEAEHELISTSVDIEEIDAGLYRSKTLWLPPGARGVFGGQVISQALLAATRSVPDTYSAHSLHCYFLLSASPAQPILYTVRNVRQGRTYATRSVRASQSGKVVFIALCSFQVPEPTKVSHQWPFPANVTPPEQCETSQQRYDRLSSSPGVSDATLRALKTYLSDRTRSPIEVRLVGKLDDSGESLVTMYWMKARGIPAYPAQYHKCIFAYISDLHLLGSATRALGMTWRGPDESKRIGMMSSLDHSIWYYDHEFDTGDWMLYVMESPTSGMGRALTQGRAYTRDGKLVAAISQEGVVRRAEKGVSHSQPKPVGKQSKL